MLRIIPAIDERAIASCLALIAVSLLVVGIASGTVIRHLIQVAPLLLAIVMLSWRAGAGAYAALPLFLNWTLIPVLIWLYLLNLSRIAKGHYTLIEIAMTVVMALCSIVGAVGSVRLGMRSSWLPRVCAFMLFVALQIAGMWISFLRPFANR
jgi:hypothetical protein